MGRIFYATPEAITNVSVVEWSEANLKNFRTVDLGQGIHLLQEEHPEAIGMTLADWIQQFK
jgi:haloalkane dehalogenase